MSTSHKQLKQDLQVAYLYWCLAFVYVEMNYIRVCKSYIWTAEIRLHPETRCVDPEGGIISGHTGASLYRRGAS
jgi:hypothetical protein